MQPTKKHSQAKLTEEQVREIRRHFRMADRLQRQRGRRILPPGMIDRLAAKYGVSRRTIMHLRTGDRWQTLK